MRQFTSTAERRVRLGDETDVGLVELMVAVLVLTTGILTLAGTLHSSRRLVSGSERQNAAAHLAE